MLIGLGCILLLGSFLAATKGKFVKSTILMVPAIILIKGLILL